MGFRTGAYAKVWEVKPVSDFGTKLRISISRKNRQTGEYEQDFSGYVLCSGSSAADKAAKLPEGARIRIGDCDVTTKYDKEKRVTYTNYRIYSFEDANGTSSSSKTDSTAPQPTVDEGEIDESNLPF